MLQLCPSKSTTLPVAAATATLVPWRHIDCGLLVAAAVADPWSIRTKFRVVAVASDPKRYASLGV